MGKSATRKYKFTALKSLRLDECDESSAYVRVPGDSGAGRLHEPIEWHLHGTVAVLVWS